MAMLKTLGSKKVYINNNCCYTIVKTALMHETDKDSNNKDYISYSIFGDKDRKLAYISLNSNGKAVCDLFKVHIDSVKDEEIFKVIEGAKDFIEFKDIKVIFGTPFVKWEIADFRLNPSK